ncbi:hypothetical protein Bbelb_365700 [Branchiostoma belcheri]|nr:hypothetical protein Bbelb_365700 [Branchiostoma belcheri]
MGVCVVSGQSSAVRGKDDLALHESCDSTGASCIGSAFPLDHTAPNHSTRYPSATLAPNTGTNWTWFNIARPRHLNDVLLTRSYHSANCAPTPPHKSTDKTVGQVHFNSS